MATSTIPAAIDGIIAGLKAYNALKGVTIIDGQPLTDLPDDYVAIGFADDMSEAISGNQEPAGLGAQRRQEMYTINCEVSAWTGSTVMKTARDKAFSILASVENVVRHDGTLGKAVIFADFGANMSVAQIQTEKGATVVIRFDIAIKITRI